MKKRNESVSVVLVGIGGYGTQYVDALLRDSDMGLCTIVGVVDPIAEKSPKYELIRERDIPICKTIEEFYETQSANLCCIAAPIQYHTPYSVYAMEHGSHVLCEKPLSGNWADAIALEALSEKTGNFVMIGYQWSYSDAILNCKRDILAGKFGKPCAMKTIVLWPRTFSYFNRGTGWAGKCYAEDGIPIFDSVANNAAAHYLHNMLFLTGDAMNRSADFASVDAELLRANPIENFDTCAIRLHMKNGAEAIFLASHATKEQINPKFEYEFENATLYYGDEQAGDHLKARMNDGTWIDYGTPFADQMEKIRYAIEAVYRPEIREILPCTPITAMPHARCIGLIADTEIVPVPPEMSELIPCGSDGTDMLRSVNGLHDAMVAAYEEGCLLSELENDDSKSLRAILKPKFSIR